MLAKPTERGALINISLFDYDLPMELIAQAPTNKRDDSRLLVVQDGKFSDHHFCDIVELLDDKHFLVLNNTKVLPARLPASKVTGGRSEIFYLESLAGNKFTALVKGKFSAGAKLLVVDESVTLERPLEDGVWQISSPIPPMVLLERYGKLPLPPYIRREADSTDDTRYQTVYAAEKGSVAAPTAGLHFTESILAQLKAKGVRIIYVTLHVGIGTFRPIKTDDIDEHIMHTEHYHISDEAAAEINSLIAAGKTLVAVGTTSVRTLESAAECIDGRYIVSTGYKDTDIFIKPGYEFKVVKGIVTNFHLPKSSLLVLLSAFMGLEPTKECYAHAVEQRYRFFSYGDAMMVL
ncbi:MAG: tRNA preQ1(34) S-adenosylmethionine ribosyltransferase-isomerase QueA [Deferribacteraceae bacterium]|nr:tRNA preQ1(34) S-adenosylmethionine ribosyltransferase-isomerase QueA [Deferribacteraceae bacterium]